MKQLIFSRTWILVFGFLLISAGCKKKEVPQAPPTTDDVAFSYTFDKENPNLVHFKNESKVQSWYTFWDLGANNVAEGQESSKFFIKQGKYMVRLKLFTVSGTAELTKEITIAADFKGKNLIKGGEMKTGDETNWTILNISNGVSWTFNNGSATAKGGNGGHQGMYQALTVEAGKKYKLDMRVFGSGASDVWFEAYVNEKAPVAGQDYSGVPVAIALNTWSGCGKAPFDDKLSVISCSGRGNEMQFTKSGTVYLVIKTGGSNLGTTGISMTDVEFYAIN